ncbi:effector-associated constant component EACC1 [Amycolatopsis sp. lyj-112]|uniref:effector-associated constant component EACC1 n=1 Tax=Amycolatopsis sp. lyj-112 TaxID=2789288 RepID=UPI003978C817
MDQAAKITLLDGVQLDAERRFLRDWFRTAPGFRGSVRTPTPPPESGKLGGVSDVLVVVFGAGGTATLFVKLLADWLVARRPKVRIKVTGPDGRTVEVETENLTGDQLTDVVSKIVHPEDRA